MKTVQVTIIYALSNIQHVYIIQIKLGSTVKDAILASKILNNIKNIKLRNNIGIYNKLVNLNDKIKSGDRIEIYRNLIMDPKERRRKNFFIFKDK